MEKDKDIENRQILTPKIANFKERIQDAQKLKKKPAILLTTGSFNPIHKGFNSIYYFKHNNKAIF